MDSFFDEHVLILGQESLEYTHIMQDRDFLLGNAIMASIPNHPFWPAVFEELRKRTAIEDVTHSTGPYMITDVFSTFNRNISIFSK